MGLLRFARNDKKGGNDPHFVIARRCEERRKQPKQSRGEVFLGIASSLTLLAKTYKENGWQ